MSLIVAPTPFDGLTDDLIFIIAQHLPDADAAVLRRVSTRLRMIGNRELQQSRLPRMVQQGTSAQYAKLSKKRFDDVDQIVKFSATRGVSVAHDTSMSTGRSLLLNRFLRLPDPMEMHFSRDNYMTTLGLTHAFLQSLSRKRILDVGCGLSIFGSEAAVLYDITVDRIDLNASKFGAPEILNVITTYVESMAILFYLSDQRMGYMIERSTQVAEYQNVLPRLRGHLSDVIFHYHQSQTSNPIRNLDATVLPGVNDDAYDGVVCTWVLMYLRSEDQAAAMKQMVRVTRVGGQIRILPGDTLRRRHTITAKDIKKWCTAGDKTVDIVEYAPDGLMVLNVIQKDSCVVM